MGPLNDKAALAGAACVNLNILTLLSDLSVNDDVLVGTEGACQALGPPGKPLAPKLSVV